MDYAAAGTTVELRDRVCQLEKMHVNDRGNDEQQSLLTRRIDAKDGVRRGWRNVGDRNCGPAMNANCKRSL